MSLLSLRGVAKRFAAVVAVDAVDLDLAGGELVGLFGGFTRSEAELRRGFERSFDLFPRLAERRDQLAATLSGGEQQMLALARALMPEPKLLLVDEISWGLMPILVAQVFARLASLNRSGLTILQVEQNAREVLRHAHVMAVGKIVFAGPAAAVANDPRVLGSYVG